MKRIVLTILMLAAFGIGANAQKKLKKDLDVFVEKCMKAFPEIPGLGVAVVNDGKVIAANGYGYADIEKGTAATGETPFYIASCTKQFTGLLAAMLDAEGRIDLKKPILQYKPFTEFERTSVFDSVTSEELLCHNDGILNDYLTYRNAITGEYTHEKMQWILEHGTSKNDEGKVFNYDNLGYNIFDIILEDELGVNWRDALAEKVFGPLGMTSTTAYMSKAKNMAMPYMSFNAERKPERVTVVKNDAAMQAAGGLVCSPNDAANWLLFNLGHGQFDGKQVVNSAIVDRTHTSLVEIEGRRPLFEFEGYGLGWNIAKMGDEKALAHNGGFTGAFSHMSILPERNMGVAVFCNEGMVGREVSMLIADFAYQYMIKGASVVPEFEKRISDLEKRVLMYQKRIAEDRANRDKREWKLSLPTDAYAGEYYNVYSGTMNVSVKENKPYVTAGIGHSLSTAGVRKDEIRVEMMPGRGAFLQFILEDGKVVALKYYDDIYYKR